MRSLKGLKYWLMGMFLVFLLSGAYPYFNFNENETSVSRVHEGLPKKENSVFTLNLIPASNSFLWRERSRAFHYRDRNYDVVKSEIVNGKLVLKCIDDVKKNHVFKGLSGLMTCCESSNDQSCNPSITGCDDLANFTADTVFVFVICPDGDGFCCDAQTLKSTEGVTNVQCN